MDSTTGAGKQVDRTTLWSKFEWDSRGFWVSSRLGPSGEVEYQYDGVNQQAIVGSTPKKDWNISPGLPGAFSPVTSGRTGSGSATSTYALGGYTSTLNSTGSSTLPAFPTVAMYGQHYQNISAAQNSQWQQPLTRSSAGPPGFLPSTSLYPTSYPNSQNMANLTQNFQNAPMISSDGASGAGPSPPLTGGSLPNGVLDMRYQVVPQTNKTFWVVGRVFMVLWTDAARDLDTTDLSPTVNQSQYSIVWLGGTVYTNICRFVVIRDGYGSVTCSPIKTYGSQATLKANLPERQQHAIIYTSENCPPEHSIVDKKTGRTIREQLNKDPIKVRRELFDDEGDLGVYSRLNYSKVHTIEKYRKVLNIGVVDNDCLASLNKNCYLKPELSSQKPQKPDRNHKSGRAKDEGAGSSKRTESSGGSKSTEKSGNSSSTGRTKEKKSSGSSRR